ncbi:MAG: hypothetical protein LC126_00820 [Bryobacterales bacterium]|nr:hypothetical protein [Bryobacterales bacterium]
MMTMLDRADDGGQFATETLARADTEDLADTVGRQTPEAGFATTFEDFVNSEG